MCVDSTAWSCIVTTKFFPSHLILHGSMAGAKPVIHGKDLMASESNEDREWFLHLLHLVPYIKPYLGLTMQVHANVQTLVKPTRAAGGGIYAILYA